MDSVEIELDFYHLRAPASFKQDAIVIITYKSTTPRSISRRNQEKQNAAKDLAKMTFKNPPSLAAMATTSSIMPLPNVTPSYHAIIPNF